MARKKSIDEIHYGPEPDHESVMDIHGCFNWYSYMSDRSKSAGWIADWMEQKEYKSDWVDKVRKFQDYLPNSTAALARMDLRGVPCITDPNYDPPPKLGGMTIAEKIEPLVDSIIRKIETKKEKRKYNPKKPLVSIQERMDNKANELSSEIDYYLDSYVDGVKSDFNVFGYLGDQQVSAPVALRIADIFRPTHAELVEAVEGKDPQLKEGYSFFTKSKLRQYEQFVATVITSIEKYAEGKSKRKKRRKKIFSAEQQIKNLKYKWSDPDYELTSIDPAQIVGCLELWTFNAKTKEVTRYLASDRGGIGVKGTTLQNYNGSSQSKKIGNKTEYYLDRIQKGGKIVLSRILDEIKTKSVNPTGRINKHTILLKAI